MKITRIYYIIALIIAGMTLSCSVDEIDNYHAKDNIYFTWPGIGAFVGGTWFASDSLSYSFALVEGTVSQAKFGIPVSVQGYLSEEDREYSVQVRSESNAVEGVHFELPEKFIFRANLAVDTLYVTLNRTEDMKEQEFSIFLELLENENFATQMKFEIEDENTLEGKTLTMFQLTVNDMFAVPSYWFSPYLGDFTVKKMNLMAELLGIPFNYYMNQISISECQYHGQFMQRYLNEKKAAGETIFEDDGTEMIMGIYVQ
ncbi:DUF4843 domain-containing protein [Robertkochia solimangrovi]|uniref:DUF4843 domain-containing protein n=1 Tax=Robertkochia solimangrovi TaxID=2213046 RepID=UPI0011805DBD|nr:DUF4843 domain-containing protein [Robertkochia solimangrovi]TRZ43502.1 hypothetical protein DMZ48_08730 [Robertkochia solimangrovi]